MGSVNDVRWVKSGAWLCRNLWVRSPGWWPNPPPVPSFTGHRPQTDGVTSSVCPGSLGGLVVPPRGPGVLPRADCIAWETLLHSQGKGVANTRERDVGIPYSATATGTVTG